MVTEENDDGTLVRHSGTTLVAESVAAIAEQAQQMTINEIGSTGTMIKSKDDYLPFQSLSSQPEHIYVNGAVGAFEANANAFNRLAETTHEGIGEMSSSSFTTASSGDDGGMFYNAISNGADFQFLQNLSNEELIRRKACLEGEMDAEIEELRRRYQTKRQPILDAIQMKKNGVA